MGTLARVLGGSCLVVHLIVGLTGCVPSAQTSSVPFGSRRFAALDRVQIGATVVPAAATELGIVEAHSASDNRIESLIRYKVARFVAQGASDENTSSFELHRTSSMVCVSRRPASDATPSSRSRWIRA